MADRLSPLDVSFLYLEGARNPMHVGSLSVFDGRDEGSAVSGASDGRHERLAELVADRLAYVPRYRQRVKFVPGHLANPVWVDDENFDLGYHVRRSALPRPGSDEQLHELVARIMSRRLDRDRPLWECYLIEGMSGSRFAILTKTHQALVDGVAAVDLGQVMLDPTPDRSVRPHDTWRPQPEPTPVELVVGALTDAARRPADILDTVRSSVDDARETGRKLLTAAGGLLAVARSAASPAPSSPLNEAVGEARRFATAELGLDVLKDIRSTQGGSINDVALTVVAGALRSWLLARGRPVSTSTTMRALVPVSVRATEEADPQSPRPLRSGVAARVASYLVDLPVGEPNPIVRLERVAFAMRAHTDSGRAVGAEALVRTAGFAPPTLHSLGARVMLGLSRRMFNLVITNVPGPQQPLYADGARLLGSYPVMPLTTGQALAVGLTSYDGQVFVGLNADRDAMPDLELLVACLGEAAEELRAAALKARPGRRRR
ncbi:MAG: WS/DGAT/MGAT family O-acyltransferase [Actinomycetales bacterium]